MIISEEIAWTAIAGLKGVGPKTLWKFYDYLESKQMNILSLIENANKLNECLGSKYSGAEIQTALDKSRIGVLNSDNSSSSILYPSHHIFPQQIHMLRRNFSLPGLIYAKGNLDLLSKQAVAIAGARNVSNLAMNLTENLVSALTQQDFNIISGYAKGVDSTAHLSALKNNGTTTIVLAEGLNSFRIKREIKPFYDMVNTVVLSQFEPNARWSPHYAMTRNKLICAISSLIIIVVSGKERDHRGRMSGTFDSGLTALKMGIPVFVVSPAYFDDQPEGNKILIERGCYELDPSTAIDQIVSTIAKKPINHKKKNDISNEVNSNTQLEFF